MINNKEIIPTVHTMQKVKQFCGLSSNFSEKKNIYLVAGGDFTPSTPLTPQLYTVTGLNKKKMCLAFFIETYARMYVSTNKFGDKLFGTNKYS